MDSNRKEQGTAIEISLHDPVRGVALGLHSEMFGKMFLLPCLAVVVPFRSGEALVRFDVDVEGEGQKDVFRPCSLRSRGSQVGPRRCPKQERRWTDTRLRLRQPFSEF